MKIDEPAIRNPESHAPNLFPICLKLEGRLCLVVGAGTVGESKIEGLLAAGAAVRVVAPSATDAVRQLARAGTIRWEVRCFEPYDLDGVFLVVVATVLECVGSLIWGAYTYRLSNLPLYVPAGHGLFYLSALRAASISVSGPVARPEIGRKTPNFIMIPAALPRLMGQER